MTLRKVTKFVSTEPGRVAYHVSLIWPFWSQIWCQKTQKRGRKMSPRNNYQYFWFRPCLFWCASWWNADFCAALSLVFGECASGSKGWEREYCPSQRSRALFAQQPPPAQREQKRRASKREWLNNKGGGKHAKRPTHTHTSVNKNSLSQETQMRQKTKCILTKRYSRV